MESSLERLWASENMQQIGNTDKNEIISTLKM